jgi:uncharacterized protein (DUF849 family)
VDWGLAGGTPFVTKLFLNGFGASTQRETKLLMHFLSELRALMPVMPSWMPVVAGSEQFSIAAVSIALGGHVRVGLGDHHYAEIGAPSNAALVERAVTIARAIGREPATPDEARQIWGIKPCA